MAEEPSLPRLPLHACGPVVFKCPSKKRRWQRRSSPLASSSSDPAFFSSDDDPALDNYINGRKKKRYIGSWFNQQPASAAPSDSALGEVPSSPPRPKPAHRRKFQRQADSGVWMASDDGDESSDDSWANELSTAAAQYPGRLEEARHRLPPHYLNSEPEQRERMRRIISRCIEKGDETIDLSSGDFETADNEIISQISEFDTIPVVEKDVPFEQVVPSLKVFLSSNAFTRLPRELFNADHITVLSLRQNRLQEIPPAISKMKNLQSLNVSQNLLRSLPSELLELMQPGSKLQDLRLVANPWYRPELPFTSEGAEEYERLTFRERPPCDWDKPTHLGSWKGLSTKLLGRSPVQYRTSLGSLQSTFSFKLERRKFQQFASEPFTELEPPLVLGRQKKNSRWNNDLIYDRVPSLVEMCLSVATSAASAEELQKALEGANEPIQDIAQEASYANDIGGYKCCVCGGKMLIPRAKWVEWRTIYNHELSREEDSQGISDLNITLIPIPTNDERPYIPFMRTGCSWRCIPTQVKEAGGSQKSPGQPSLQRET